MTTEQWTLIIGILGGLIGSGTFYMLVRDRGEHCQVLFSPGEAVDVKQDGAGGQYEVPADGFNTTLRNSGRRSFYVQTAHIEAREVNENVKIWFKEKTKYSATGFYYGGDRFELEPGRSVISTIPERQLIDTFKVLPDTTLPIRVKVTLESGKEFHSKYLELSESAEIPE
jgi:hypothetical protein